MKRYKSTVIYSSIVKTAKKHPKDVSIIKPDSAGIDIGSRSHYVAVPPDRCEGHVREFSSVTGGLLEMVKWLKECSITTVAIESTGSYWIPCYEILEANGIEVYLVQPEQVKSKPGRKTDVIDCQWIQKLHSHGLLTKSFRPQDHCLRLRNLTRLHSSLIEHRSPHIKQKQKALQEMNVQLHTHVRDITGVTGTRIIDAILDGERNPAVFASMVHKGCKHTPQEIADALNGNYRSEHLYTLKVARDIYRFYSQKLIECEAEIESALKELEIFTRESLTSEEQEKQLISESQVSEDSFVKKVKRKKSKKGLSIHIKELLSGISGIDLTTVSGIDQVTALKLIAELGGNVDAWASAKHFASWLGLCPGNKKSGGKQMSSKTKHCANRVAQILRMAANGLWRSKCYLGAYIRRMKSKLGGMEAITCAAHKLARIIYNMIKTQKNYVELGVNFYEEKYKERRLKALRRQAEEMGLDLVVKPT